MELPIRSCSELVPIGNSLQLIESDHDVRTIAAEMGLLSNSSPPPSMQMLLNQLSKIAIEAQLRLPLKGPALDPFVNFKPVNGSESWWAFISDAPWWGNNDEASSSKT